MFFSQIETQQVMESELQEQIAGAGSDPQYLAANEIGLDPLEESDQVEISLSKPLVSGLMTSTAQNVENQDEGQYLENTTEYRMSIGGLFTTTKLFSDDGSINAAKLAQGSEMIDGENDGVQDLLEQILDAAGLSEIPEGMSEAEYQELVAQAILEWLLQNWQYIEDGNYDEWQNVMESLGLSGDCEDFAILLASLLIAAGIDPENVAVVISADGTHAFVAVEIDGKVYILDNNGEFVETEYASLNELLADEEMAGAWFKQGGAYGINNEDLNINTADGSQGTGGNEWIDAFNEADAGMEEMYDGWNEDDMIDENSHGDFNTLNEEAVKSFTEMALERLTRLLMLAMAANMDSDVRDVIEEILTDMPLEEEDKSTLRGSILKLFSAKMKTMQQAFSKLLERVNKHNEKVMNDKIEDAKEKSESTSFKLENWYQSGYQAESLNRQLAKDQLKYLRAIDKNVEVFKSLIHLMIEIITDGAQGGGDLTHVLTGVVHGLKQIAVKMDAFSEQIDEKIQETEEYIESLSSDEDCGSAWSMVWDGITEGSWDKFWGGLQSVVRVAQNWLEDNLGVFGQIISKIVELFQWGLGIMRNPYEFCLSFLEGILDIVALALDYIGEFIDKLIWSIFGWIWDTDAWTSGDGWSDTWTDWSGDDGYGTHGVGDIVQWVGKVIVDDILDNIIMDNLCDAIRFVLYECISRAWNALKEFLNEHDLGWITTITWFIPLSPTGHIDSLNEPGERDYFGIESIDWDGVGGYSSYDEDGRKAVHKEDLWGWGCGNSSQPLYDPSAFQDLGLDVLIRDIRGGIIRSQNAFRMCMMAMLMSQDVRRAVFRTLSGLNGTSGNGKLLAKSVAVLTGPTTQILDASMSAVMLRASVYNQHLMTVDALQKLEAARAAQCASVLLTVAAAVIAIVMLAYSCGSSTVPSALIVAGAVCSVAAAAANYVAQQILADIDPFNVKPPEVLQTDEIKSPNSSKATADVLHSIDQELAALQNSLATGESYIVTTQDGMQHIDYKALASLERRMNALNNLMRAIFYMAKGKRDLNRMVQAILNGHSDEISGEGLIMGSLESMLAQGQVMITAITFQMSQVVASKNLARQAEIAQGGANAAAGGQAAGAVLALVLSFIPGMGSFASLVNICTGLMSGVTGIAQALGGDGNALGMALQSQDKEIDQYLEQRADNDETLEGKLDQREAEAMQELLQNGIVSIGDGYTAINSPLLAKTYKRMQKIFQMRMELLAARNMDSSVRAAVMQQLMGVSPSSASGLSKTVMQANFNTAMRMVGKLSAHLNSQSQVQNQARDAEKAAIMACVTGAISIVCSGIGITGLAVAKPVAEMSKALRAFVNVAQVLPAVGNVAGTLTQLIASSLAARDDKGFYSDYNAQNALDEIDRGVKSEGKSWQEKLDQQEYDIMAQMNTSLIEDMGQGFQGVSADSADISYGMDKLYNMRVAIAKVLDIKKQVRAVLGHGAADTSLENILEANRSAAKAVLHALKGALETIAQRENQMKAAAQQAVTSAIMLGFQALALAVSIAKVGKQNEKADLEANPKPNEEKIQALKDSIKNCTRWQAGLNFAGSVLPEIIYAFINTEDSSTEVKENKPSQENKEKTKAKSKGSKDKGGYASSLDQMESEIAGYEHSLAAFEASNSTRVYVAANNQRVATFLQNLPSQMTSMLQNVLAPGVIEKAMAPEAKDEKADAGALGASEQAATAAPAGQPPVEQKQAEQTPQSTRVQALLDQANKISEAIDANMAVLAQSAEEQQPTNVARNTAAVQQQVEHIKERQAETRVELEKADAEHKVAETKVQELTAQEGRVSGEMTELQKELERMKETLRQKRDTIDQLQSARENGELSDDAKAKVDADIASLDSECEKLEHRIKQLEQQLIPDKKAQLTDAQEKLAVAKGERAEALGEVETLSKEMGALEQMTYEALLEQRDHLSTELKEKADELARQRKEVLPRLEGEHQEAVEAEMASARKAIELTAKYKRAKAQILLETQNLSPKEYQAWQESNSTRLEQLTILERDISIEKARTQTGQAEALRLQQEIDQTKGAISNIQKEIIALRQRIGQLNAQLQKAARAEGEGKAVAGATDTGAMDAAVADFESDVESIRDTERRANAEIAKDCMNLGPQGCKKVLLSENPPLTSADVAEVIGQVATTDRKRAENIYKAVRGSVSFSKEEQAKIAAALSPTVAPAPVTDVAPKPVTAPPTASQDVFVYDKWIETMQIGKVDARAKKLATDVDNKVTAPAQKAIQEADVALQNADKVDKTLSPQEKIQILEAKVKELAAAKQKVQARIQVLREKVLPKAQARSAKLVAAVEKEAQAITTRQLEVGRQIEVLRSLENPSPEDQAKLVALEKEAKELVKAQTRLQKSRGLCEDPVKEVEDQIRQLDTKAKEMEAKKQSMLEDIRTLRKGTVAKPGAKKGAVTAKKDAPKKVGAKGAAKKGAAQEGDEDVVVEVADAGGNGEDGSGAQDEGQQEQQNRKGLLSMLFGDFGKNEQPVAPGVTRISHQVGNIPGDEAHEQFERSLEDSNYIRSA